MPENGETINSNFGRRELMVSSFFIHQFPQERRGKGFTIQKGEGFKLTTIIAQCFLVVKLVCLLIPQLVFGDISRKLLRSPHLIYRGWDTRMSGNG